MAGTVSRLRSELRSTRMSVFEAQQGTKEALDQVQDMQDTLLEQVDVRCLICATATVFCTKARNCTASHANHITLSYIFYWERYAYWWNI
jgi:hypothetical protein